MGTISNHRYISKFSIILSFPVIIGVCLFSYWPGLDGIFLVDDYPNLSTLNVLGGVTDLNSFLTFVFGNHSGAAGRPVSMLSFLINDQFWPGSPSSYKYTNLMIHCLCGVLIIALCYQLSLTLSINEQKAACIGIISGAIWMLHPFNVSTTLYVIQRMAQLSALFSLAGILCYCYGRKQYDTCPNKSLFIMSIGVMLFGVLSVFSKENGVLMVLLIGILEYTIFQHLGKTKAVKIWLFIFVYAPIGVLLLHFASRGFYTNSYQHRAFTMFERLLTENRILLDYLHSILMPHLSGNGLINDDIEVSKNLFTPISTFFAVLVNFVLVGLAIYFRKKAPVAAFSILWFFGGHLLESTFIPLELYFEHRNYLPMVGIIFGLVYYFLTLPNYLEKIILKRLIMAIPVMLAFFSAMLTHQSAIVWSDPGTLFRVWSHEHPESPRAQRTYGQYLAINNEPELAMKVLDSAFEKFPYDISLPIGIIDIACKHNLTSKYSIEDLKTFSRSSTFTDGIWVFTNSLVDNIVKKNCSQLNLQDAMSILSIVEETPQLAKNPRTLAKILFLHSDLYVLNRQLSPAVELLDRVYSYQRRNVTVPIRQARLLASAGLYNEAQHYIAIAKETDRYRKRFTPSQMPQIIELELSIQSGRT